MKIYSVFLGFGFMLLAGVSSSLQKCEGRSGLAQCVHFGPDGKDTPGYYCTSGGDYGNCGAISNCAPSM